MEILIFVAIVVIVLALIVYAINLLPPPIGQPWKNILAIIVILIGVLLILQRSRLI